TSACLLQHCAQQLALDRRSETHEPARHRSVREAQAGSDLPSGVLGLAILQRHHCTDVWILDLGEQALYHCDPRLSLARLVARLIRFEAQLRYRQEFTPARVLHTGAATEVGGDGEEPASKSVPLLEL